MNLLSDASPEVLTQFSAESVEKNVRAESNARYEEMLEAALEGTNEDETMGGAQV